MKMRVEWMPAVLAALAFVGVAAVFAREVRSFRAAVLEWAGNDLDSRTRIAVETLREPLRSGDFAAVHRFSDECAVDHVRLTVFGHPRGLVFDSLGPDAARRDAEFLLGPRLDAGAFSIRLARPLDRVLAPFHRARLSYLLAFLLGMAGVALFFVVIYRQRVRLREMARVERFRRDFIADVSHEIKTPLTGILGAVDLMEATVGAPETHRKLTGLVRREAGRLHALVQSILDLARLEREGEVLKIEDTDIVRLTRELAEEYGIAVAGEPSDGTRPPVRCDPLLIRQALANLIENAKRHSGTTDIFLSTDFREKTVQIAVEDHGIGIPPEHAARVFDRFHRVDPARASETGGAGLGLAIVRRIARLHGGDAVYRPAKPRGCVFVLSLPLRPRAVQRPIDCP